MFILIPATDIRGEKNKEDLEALLDSLTIGEYDLSKVIVGLDAVQENFTDYFADKYKQISFMYNNGNRFQFTRNVNALIRFAWQRSVDDVILVNQDCILPNNKYLARLAHEGIVNASSIDEKNIDKLNELNLEDGFKSSIAPWTKVSKVPFYCTFISKECIEKIGLLDGALRITHSDDDYCLRAQLVGLPVETSSVLIYHYGTHSSMDKEGQSGSGAYTVKDLGTEHMMYRVKWGCPKHLKHEEIIPWALENHKWKPEMKCN